MNYNIHDRRYLSFPTRRVSVGIGVLVLVISALAASSWVLSHRVRETINSQLEIEREVQRVAHYGDVLWLSMRLVVENGDPIAIAEYRRIQPELRQILIRLRRDVVEDQLESASGIDEADRELISMEASALSLVEQRKFAEAQAIVRGSRYQRLADVYLRQTRSLQVRSAHRLQDLDRQLDYSLQVMVFLSGAALGLFVIWWVLLLRPARRWGNSLASARREAEDATIELVKDQLRLEEANHRLSVQARIDPLTGALSRRCLNEQVLDSGAANNGGASATIMCDVDNFKQFNDSAGHLAGDAVLQSIATALSHAAGRAATVYRFGGEEFAVVLNDHKADPVALAERLREAVEALQIPNPGLSGQTVTISAGVAFRREFASVSECLDGADRALYDAKRKGRNRVSCCSA